MKYCIDVCVYKMIEKKNCVAHEMLILIIILINEKDKFMLKVKVIYEILNKCS